MCFLLYNSIDVSDWYMVCPGLGLGLDTPSWFSLGGPDNITSWMYNVHHHLGETLTIGLNVHYTNNCV